jgi:tubulin polyglutamylase TTLL4
MEKNILKQDLYNNNDENEMDSEDCIIDPEVYTRWAEDNNKYTKLYIVESKHKPNKFYYYIYSDYEVSMRPENLLDPSDVDDLDREIYYKSYKKNPVCLSSPLEAAGFKKTKSLSKANIIWKLYKYDEMLKLIPKLKKHQKYNHFPKTYQLGRKDNLWRNYSKLNKAYPNDYNFIPITYLIPNNIIEFKANYKNSNMWIVKPKNSARGSGVRLLKNISDLPKECIVSKYLDNPHLINNKKYDLRLYVLITSYVPLKIYFYKEGLVRFASEDYTKQDKDNIFIHLTNYAVNKKNVKYMKNNNDDLFSSKWSLSAYRRFLASKGLENEHDEMFLKIKDIIIKTIISISEESISIIKSISKHPNTIYEVYGFDIFIDAKFRPWLLEVNVSPSLNCDSELDLKIKTQLLTDVFNTIGIQALTKCEREKVKVKDKANNNREDKSLLSQLRIKICKEYDNKNPNLKFSEDEFNKRYEDMIIQYEDEIVRRGNFELLFPVKENIKTYCKFIKAPYDENIILWKWIMSNKPKLNIYK